MTINISTQPVEIARFAGALYGLVLDNATTVAVENSVNAAGSSLNAVINGVYGIDFANATNANVGATVAANLGLTGNLATQASAYITAQLNAAAAGTQGQTLMNVLNLFGTLTSDPTWGTAATAWESKVSAAVTYGQNAADTSNSTVASLSSAAAPTIFSLTTGIDNFTGLTSGNNAFNATDATSVSNPNGNITLTPSDKITATGSGNVLNVIYSNHDIANVVGLSVSGVQTANLTVNGKVGAAGAAFDTSGWTGLTTLNTNAGGTTTLNAAATTNVTSSTTSASAITIDGGLAVTATTAGGVVTIGANTGPAGAIIVNDTNVAAALVAVDGGTTVSVTDTGNTGGTITIGANTKPTGAITVNNTVSSGTGGAIAVTGGTTVNVTQTTSNSVNTTANEGAVTVTGGTATTTVTVNQAQATAAPTLSAVAGVVTVTGVTAIPGVNGVTAVSGVTPVAAQAGVVGATAGAVTVADANYASGTNTITTVSLNNYGASSISSKVLSNLSLQGVGGTLNLNNSATTSNNTLNLTVNGLKGANNINDGANAYTTLNVTTATADSTLTNFADTGLTKLNISGTNKLTLGGNLNATGKLAIAVSGSAGFNDGAAAIASGVAFLSANGTLTTTSSGVIQVALNDTTQTFTGSTGQDIIMISDLADAAKAITGGSATNNELVLAGGAYALTSVTGTLVTGFQTLGVTTTVTGNIDMSKLASGFNALDVQGSTGVAFTNVATNSSVAIDQSTTGTVSVTYKDGTGLHDVVGLTIGTSSTKTAQTVTALSLQDVNGIGIATLNVTNNNSAFNTANVITALTDNGLATLNVGGTGGLTITALSETASPASTFTVNNTETNAAGVAITTLTDNSLVNLVFNGTNSTTIGTLADSTTSAVTISNNGTGMANIGTWSGGAMTSITLTDKVSIGAASTTAAEALIGIQDSSTAGVAVYGSADNSHVSISLTTGAIAGKTDTIQLGNANNYISDVTAVGSVSVAVGTGSNYIVLGAATTDTTGAYSVTLGTHTATSGMDQISIGTVGPSFATAANLTVTGAVTGDQILLLGDTGAVNLSGTGLTGGSGTITINTSVANSASVAAAISTLETAVGSTSHGIAVGQYGGNTYIVESNSAATASGITSTVIELVGLHTISAVAGATTLHIAS